MSKIEEFDLDESHGVVVREVLRLRRTLAVLIAAGFVTEEKVEHAYEIAEMT